MQAARMAKRGIGVSCNGFKSGRRRVGLEGTWGAGCAVILGLPSPRTWDGGLGSEFPQSGFTADDGVSVWRGLRTASERTGRSAKKPPDFWTCCPRGVAVPSRTGIGVSSNEAHSGRRRSAFVVGSGGIRGAFGADGEGGVEAGLPSHLTVPKISEVRRRRRSGVTLV
jgi:hypothetical protein